MRWILLLVTVLGFCLCFMAKWAGLAFIGLLLGFGGLFGFIFALAAARINVNARSEVTLLTDKETNALRISAQQARASKNIIEPSRKTTPTDYEQSSM